MKNLILFLVLAIMTISCSKSETEDLTTNTDTTSTTSKELTLSEVESKIIGSYTWQYNVASDYTIQFAKDNICYFTFAVTKDVVQYTYSVSITDSTFEIDIIRPSASDLIFYECTFSGDNIVSQKNSSGYSSTVYTLIKK